MALHSRPQTEVEKREQRLDVLQERVAELKEKTKLQETPIQMQVNVVSCRSCVFVCLALTIVQKHVK